MNGTGALRIGFALAILLALFLYFAPIVPVQVSCASIPPGGALLCFTGTAITSYKSPMRALFGFGAASDYRGYYSPEITFGTNGLTTFGAFYIMILPAILIAGVLFLGKGRLTRITSSVLRLLNRWGW